MIVLVVILEKNKLTNKEELITSHGVNYETGATIILPCEHPLSLGGVKNSRLGSWVIYQPGDDVAALSSDIPMMNVKAMPIPFKASSLKL